MALSRRTAVLVWTLASALGSAAWAQEWPNRPIKIVVPFPAGGNTDAVARMTATRLQELLGQSVVVENKAGGGGVIATDFVAKAAPDGYTLLMSSTGPHTVMPALMPKIPYDAVRDLAPISNVASNAQVLLVHSSFPAKTVPELIALLKREPGKHAFGSGGVASTTHMSGELFKSMAGVNMIHVPFKGGAPLAVASISGEVPISFNNMYDALPHIRSGRLRGLAVTSATRQAPLPDVPTLAELGLTGYESGPWNGLVAPAKTPPVPAQAATAKPAAVKPAAAPAPKPAKPPPKSVATAGVAASPAPAAPVPVAAQPANRTLEVKPRLERIRKPASPAPAVVKSVPVEPEKPKAPIRKVTNLNDINLPEGYKPSPGEEYMNPMHLAFFRNMLDSKRQQLIGDSQGTIEHLRTETRDVGDEAERASRESDNILELRTRDRERKLLRKIEEALKRIEDGSYGYCEETGEEIGLGRLEARPTATLTVDAQERREKLQRQYRDDH